MFTVGGISCPHTESRGVSMSADSSFESGERRERTHVQVTKKVPEHSREAKLDESLSL